MSSVNLKWDADGVIDYYSVYRSESVIDVNNLPEPIATNILVKNYSDTTVEAGKNYHYIVSSTLSSSTKLSEVIQVSTTSIAAGVWVSAFSENTPSVLGNSFNKAGTQDALWDENFGKTSNFAVSGYSNAGRSEELGVINKSVYGLNFHLYGRLSYNAADNIQFLLEFKNTANTTIFAIEMYPSGYLSVGLKYGPNPASLMDGATTGEYPFVDGLLAFTDIGATYTPYNSSNNNSAFSFPFDCASVASIVVTKNRVQRYFADDNYSLYTQFKCIP